MQIDLTCIIDDDEIYVFGIKHLMQRVNFSKNIMVFENGQEALRFLTPIIEDEEALPNVILLDINMPIMDGWQFLDEFVKIQTPSSRKLTIYMMSSSVNPADIERAKSYELISDYIIKPIDQNQLELIMETVM